MSEEKQRCSVMECCLHFSYSVRFGGHRRAPRGVPKAAAAAAVSRAVLAGQVDGGIQALQSAGMLLATGAKDLYLPS